MENDLDAIGHNTILTPWVLKPRKLSESDLMIRRHIPIDLGLPLKIFSVMKPLRVVMARKRYRVTALQFLNSRLVSLCRQPPPLPKI